MQSRKSWLKVPRPDPHARLRLFCIPHAGGGAATFRLWQENLPAGVEVAAVQLPGREERLMEEPFSAIEPIVEVLAGELEPHLGLPYAIFGHSMGSLIGFELLRELRRRGLPGARHLFTSAHRAPQLPDRFPPIHHLPDEEFLHEVDTRYGAVPAAARADAELMELLLPGLRADVTVCDTYTYRDDAPLECAISTFGGEGDHQVNREELEAWGEQTRGPFSFTLFSGDHFFLQTEQEALLRTVSEGLQRPG